MGLLCNIGVDSMSVVFDVYTPDGNLVLTSKTKPQGFHYRFDHDVQNRTLGDSYVSRAYTGLRSVPQYSSWSRLVFRETFGGLSNEAIAKYPKFKPDIKADGDGDGHNHHYVTGGCLAWVCAPGGIYRTSKNLDGWGYSVSGTSNGVYPTCKMIVTGSQPNIEEGYLTQYDESGNTLWTITNYFRHPHVQYIWVKPIGKFTEKQIWNGSLDYKGLYKNGDYSVGAGGYQKFVSKDGHPLYVCVTMGCQTNNCGPVFRWNNDGTELEVIYEGEDVYAYDYGILSHIQVNVPVASFPHVHKDFY